MVKGLFLSIVLVLATAADLLASDCKVIIKVPDGVSEVLLMSQGTGEVLNYIRSAYSTSIRELEKKYNISELKSQANSAISSSRADSEAVSKEIQEIRNEYISKVSIRIDSVRPYISPESTAMGEIEFTYTATNKSDRIIADVVYLPRIGKMKIQTSSKLVLDFVDRKTLKAGLPPEKSLSTSTNDPDRFSFLIGQMNSKDLAYIRDNAQRDFTVDIIDINFTDSIEYKDQSKVLSIEQAFASRLKDIYTKQVSDASLAQRTVAEYKKTETEFYSKRDAAVQTFIKQAKELKKTAVRYSSKNINKGRVIFKGVTPGNYYIYASKTGEACFYEINVNKKKVKIIVDKFQKDPFVP